VTVTVRYPFTRWLAKSLTVIGSREQGGARHLIVCKPNNKTRCLLPEWMTFPEAGTIRIVACPRLSVAVRRRSRKQLLRTFVAYKANIAGIPVEIAQPHYTSQSCCFDARGLCVKRDLGHRF
jgi:hypothetical protein